MTQHRRDSLSPMNVSRRNRSVTTWTERLQLTSRRENTRNFGFNRSRNLFQWKTNTCRLTVTSERSKTPPNAGAIVMSDSGFIWKLLTLTRLGLLESQCWKREICWENYWFFDSGGRWWILRKFTVFVFWLVYWTRNYSDRKLVARENENGGNFKMRWSIYEECWDVWIWGLV